MRKLSSWLIHCIQVNNRMSTSTKWLGTAPDKCQVCGIDLSQLKYFIDGRLKINGWAIMCVGCHAQYGTGLGVGRGQKYEVKSRLKVEG